MNIKVADPMTLLTEQLYSPPCSPALSITVSSDVFILFDIEIPDPLTRFMPSLTQNIIGWGTPLKIHTIYTGIPGYSIIVAECRVLRLGAK